MRIRDGFVSNSSSSSYLLIFNQKDVIEDPQKIVDFIKMNAHLESLYTFLSTFIKGLISSLESRIILRSEVSSQ